MLNENTIVTICWVFVAVFAIAQFTIYSLVRLMVTGKPLFQLKAKPESGGSRIVGIGR